MNPIIWALVIIITCEAPSGECLGKMGDWYGTEARCKQEGRQALMERTPKTAAPKRFECWARGVG